jgi:succinate dehydrogenase/fumarate reductase flavoprotein subunit
MMAGAPRSSSAATSGEGAARPTLKDVASQHWDLICIGGGMAGLVASNRARQLGLRVIILEAGRDEIYRCNTRMSGGALHCCMADITSPEAEILERIKRDTMGAARPDLAAAIARDGRRAVQWLRAEGAQFIRVPLTGQNHVLAPPRPARPGWNWEGRGPDVLVRRLGANLMRRGGHLVRGARATELLMKDGQCVGVVAQSDGDVYRLSASAVMVADGGFQANQELMRRFISPAPEKVQPRNAQTGRGDGLRMVEAAGGHFVGRESGFYGHIMARESFTDARLSPYPFVDTLACAGMIIRHDGRRFTDEGRGGTFVANEMARLDDPLDCVVIFDRAIWDGPGTKKALPPNPIFPLSGGRILIADTIDELAAKVRIDPQVFRATVATFNEHVRHGRTETLQVPRTVNKVKAFALGHPPFGAILACPGITYTMGGIAIDGHARVLSDNDSPILGLYAAGAATGGLDGGPYSGYVGGLSKAATFGLRGAEHVGEFLAGRDATSERIATA